MPHKLLLADDSVTIQRVIELTFANEDVQVIAVSDGAEAIARLEAEPPDIVLADVGMPGKNGYEVAAYMKHTPRLAQIPIVILTGASEPIDPARFASEVTLREFRDRRRAYFVLRTNPDDRSCRATPCAESRRRIDTGASWRQFPSFPAKLRRRWMTKAEST